MQLIRPRTADFSLTYNDKDISDDIRRDILSLTYTDSASDASDSLQISVSARSSKWLNGWMPDKDAKLHPSITTRDWRGPGDDLTLNCGILVIDSLSFSDSPDTLNIGAVARPNGTDFHEQDRECTWKNTSIKRIAETIAERYGLQCKMDAEDVDIEVKEQDGNDSAFLQELCSTYGLVLKIYSQRIWIYDREAYKRAESVGTIHRTDMTPGSFGWDTTLAGSYTGGIFTYTNQKKKVDIKVTIGEGPRLKKLNQYASSEADARRRLQAAIDTANHGIDQISFSTMGRLDLAAAQCIDVAGWGCLDGKYFIDKLAHKLSRSGGLVSSFTCSKVMTGEAEQNG